MKLIANQSANTPAQAKNVLTILNDADPEDFAAQLPTATRVELQFPKFSDGRAFSQAVVLRRRLGYQGEIRATGDVLIDQLLQMQRTGFSSAVLRADQNLVHGEKLLAHFAAFYQGDALTAAPLFARAVAA